MSRSAILLFGIVALVILAFICVWVHRPVIEADLTNRTRSAMEADGMDWAEVSSDGRDIRLTGTAPTGQLRDQAGATAQKVRGVRTVRNKLVLQQIPVASPVPVPYIFTAEYGGKTAVLSGYVPDQETLTAVIADGKGRFGASEVTDRLQIVPGAPEGWDAAILGGALGNLEQYEEATAKLIDTSLMITGRVSSPVLRDQLREATLESVPETFSLTFNVTAPEPAADIPPTKDCRGIFNEILSMQKVEFGTAKALLNEGSTDFLNKLPPVAEECPDIRVEIAGHADSRGTRSYNMDLGRLRAKAVSDYLVSSGVQPGRLSIISYGESRPLADNSTPEGRSKNRRVQINLVEE